MAIVWVRTKILALARRAAWCGEFWSTTGCQTMSGAFRMSGDGRALLGSAFRRLSLVAAILDAERLAALRSLEQSLIGRALVRQRLLP